MLVRAAWTSARWLEEDGRAYDIVRDLTKSATGVIDRAIWLHRKEAAPLPLRLLAIKMPKDKAVRRWPKRAPRRGPSSARSSPAR